MRFGRGRRALVAAAAAAVVLAGCGGDDGGADASPQDPQAQELARPGLLRLDDFPAGWMATPADEDDDNDNECYSDAMKPLGSVDSESFSSDSNAQASNSVGVFTDEDGAAAALAVVRDSEVHKCLRDLIAEGIAKDAAEGDAEVVDMAFGPLSVPQYGDDQAALRLEMTVQSGPFTPTLYLDVVFVQVGRAVSAYEFVDVLSPFDDDLRGDLIDTTVERLRASVS